MRPSGWVIGLSLGATLMLGATLAAHAAPPDSHSWTSWGNGLRFNLYSAADQIDKSNVTTLAPVWRYEVRGHSQWEATPLVAGGRMFVQDPEGTAIALEPETGKEIWRFASSVRTRNRALSYWPGDGTHGPRILMAANDRIYALDAASGTPIAAFGGGKSYVDIHDGFAKPEQQYRLSSPPTIYRNLIITGVSTQEFGSKGPPGDPRAYDAVTGALVWRFHIVPRPGEPNYGSWGPNGEEGRAGPATWGMISVDEEAGLIFVPVGQPADNFVGIDRPGNNLYSDSIVALEARTGKYRWHYQMVHHDLWDYDNSSPAALVDLTVKGKRVPALVEVTKQGFMFILNRRTGKPVFGVEERAVPQSTIPGERTARTQPFPVKPPPLAKLGVSRSDISNITPEAQRFCTDMWNRLGFQDAAVFTPPSLGAPNLYAPSNAGGAGGIWNGVSVDPNSGTIFVNVTHMAAYVEVVPDDGKSKGPVTAGYRTEKAFTKWLDQNGMPCTQPPWGEMVAVNGNTGDVAWRVPLGKAEVYRDLGAHTGMINAGGSLVTASGLLFTGSTSQGYGQGLHDDPTVRAFDTKTGREAWSYRLPAGNRAAPMTFVGKDGRQYLVLSTNGRPDTNNSVIAFALPKPGDTPFDIHPAPVPPSALGKAAANMPAAPVVTRAEDLPGGPGKEDFTRVCSACHAVSTAIATPRNQEGWASTVEEMRGRGAKMDDATAQRIVAYLTAHFGAQ